MTGSDTLKRNSNKINGTDSSDSELPEAAESNLLWSCIMIGASFCIHMIADGILNTMGLLEYRLSVVFNEKKTVTSWVPSVASGMALCAGPFASLLVKKYGCRSVTIVGAVLAAVSLFVSYFAKNVPTLIITMGVGFGCGLSFALVPAIVSVTTYFDKNRSLATGIAVSGAGIGTTLFPKLIEFIIEKYDWYGYCLILSGVVLISFVICGALYRPLTESSRQIPLTKQSNKYQRVETYEIKLRRKSNSCQKPQTNSMHMLIGNNLPDVIDDQAKKRERLSLPLEKNKSKSNQRNGKPDQPNMRYTQSQPSVNIAIKTHEDYHDENRSLNSLSTQQTQSEFTVKLNQYGSVELQNENKEINSSKRFCVFIPFDKFRDAIELMNFGLLKNPVFALYVLSNFCTSIGFYIPIFSLPQHLTKTDPQLGMEKANILMIYGIVNTMGRILIGFISDKVFVNRLWVYNFSLTICGIASLALVACSNFLEFAVCAGIIGFTISVYVTLRSVILVDLLGLDKLESAFGLMLLFEGLATFIGPPISGFLHDQFDSYAHAFEFAGVMLAISGLMLFPLPKLQKYVEKGQLRRGDVQMENIVAI